MTPTSCELNFLFKQIPLATTRYLCMHNVDSGTESSPGGDACNDHVTSTHSHSASRPYQSGHEAVRRSGTPVGRPQAIQLRTYHLRLRLTRSLEGVLEGASNGFPERYKQYRRNHDNQR